MLPRLVTVVGLVAAAAASPDLYFGGGGCASGTRGGFIDEFRFPCVAACSANGASPPFHGDVGGAGAAALCAPGWHVCTVRIGGETRGLSSAVCGSSVCGDVAQQPGRYDPVVAACVRPPTSLQSVPPANP